MIKKGVQKVVAELPGNILRRLVARKVEEAGVAMPPEVVEALSQHILSGAEDSFFWDDGQGDRNIQLSFTAEEFEEAFNKVMEALPDVTLKATEATAQQMFATLCKGWSVEHAAQEFELDGFRSRLQDHWGKGLDYLRMLLTCCREIGRDIATRHYKAKARRYMFRRWVLVRLHSRACQVTDEIICLMENGFADGAMARWRTLHEISVVAALIAEGDEDLAERYVVHDAVEVKRQADDYDETQVPLGLPPIGKRRRSAIDRDYNNAITRFGPPFAHPYGWASKHLGLKKPTFKELQVAAGRGGMSSYYKMASFNVHAGARNLFFNLGSMGDEDIVPAGRSNAGLADPGENTAHTLALITSFYMGATTDLDRLVVLKCLLRIRDAAPPAFRKAERHLHRKEQALQQEIAKERTLRGDKQRKPKRQAVKA